MNKTINWHAFGKLKDGAAFDIYQFKAVELTDDGHIQDVVVIATINGVLEERHLSELLASGTIQENGENETLKHSIIRR